MPELVAVLHSFVGMAAVLVGVASYLGAGLLYANHVEGVIHAVEVCVSVFPWARSRSRASVVAFGKLRGFGTEQAAPASLAAILNLLQRWRWGLCAHFLAVSGTCRSTVVC